MLTGDWVESTRLQPGTPLGDMEPAPPPPHPQEVYIKSESWRHGSGGRGRDASDKPNSNQTAGVRSHGRQARASGTAASRSCFVLGHLSIPQLPGSSWPRAPPFSDLEERAPVSQQFWGKVPAVTCLEFTVTSPRLTHSPWPSGHSLRSHSKPWGWRSQILRALCCGLRVGAQRNKQYSAVSRRAGRSAAFSGAQEARQAPGEKSASWGREGDRRQGGSGFRSRGQRWRQMTPTARGRFSEKCGKAVRNKDSPQGTLGPWSAQECSQRTDDQQGGGL